MRNRIGSLLLLMTLAFGTGAGNAQAFVYQDRITTTKSLAHYCMGQIYEFLGLTNRAVLEYEKAIHFDEQSYLLHLRLGTGYARLNMVTEAVKELQKVAVCNPDDLQSHYLLALIYSTTKDYEKAASEYEFILKKFSSAEPQNIEIYGYLAQLYYSQKKYNEAIAQFEKILEIEPSNADVMYMLGSLYYEVNNGKRAIELLKKALTIDPEHDGSLNTLGYIYAESDENLAQAEDMIQRALKISPDNGAYLDSLGWVRYKKGQYQEALQLLLKADGMMQDPVIHEHLGDVYLKLNDTGNAVHHWEKSLELLPDQEKVRKKLNDLKSDQALKVPTLSGNDFEGEGSGSRSQEGVGKEKVH